MAKQNDKQYFDVTAKCDYFSRRVNDKSLSQGQRDYAQKRLAALRGGSKTNNSSKKYGKSFTDEQNAAYSAGIGYGAAKNNKRVPIKDENKGSFRAGLERGKRL